MFQATVLTLGVLTDDRKVNVFVARWEAFERLAEHHRCVNVQLLTHCDVPAVVRASACRRQECALQTHLVAPQAVHGLLEERIITLHLTRQVVLLPFHRHVQLVENLLH